METKRISPLFGFTLIELMIALAVVCILAAIPYPSYVNQVRKARRTEAKTFLLGTVSKQERYYKKTTPMQPI